MKNMKCMVMYMYQYPTCISCIVNDELISEISFGILYIFLSDKMFYKCSFLIYIYISRKFRMFTNKQYFLTLLHLKFFMQSQNLSEETMERIMLRSISEQQVKKCFIFVWIIFPSSDIIAISILDVQTANAQISMNWNLMLNFVKLKQTIFKRHSSSYGPYVGVGDIEKFVILTSWQASGTHVLIWLFKTAWHLF